MGRNVVLSDLLSAAGWSRQRTADLINERAHASGHRQVAISKGRVATWINKRQTPEAPVPSILADLLGQRLGRWLTPADLGFARSGADGAFEADPWHGDPVSRLISQGMADMTLDRRELVRAGMFSLAACAVPGFHATAVAPPGVRQGRVGRADVARIQEVGRHFTTLEHAYGGGHARRALAAYLVHDVAPLLRGVRGPARPELFGAAASLAYRAGWMALDDHAHGLAQRYYIAAARLASEADDLALRSSALRAMARQAVDLGHAAEAVNLAEAAISSAGATAPSYSKASYLGTLADAQAATGDRHAALKTLSRAERLVDQAESPAHLWAGTYRRHSLEWDVGKVLSHLADPAGAAAHLTASLTVLPSAQRRNRTLFHARLARNQLAARRPAEAAATVQTIATDLSLAPSARVTAELNALRQAWRPYRNDSTIAEADHMLASLA